MKKIVCRRPECIEIVDCEVPELKDDEVLVKVHRVSLCGSDYKFFEGTYNAPHSYPLVIGHEWSGEVLETGNKEVNLQAGDRVTGECSVWCGECQSCIKDKNICEHISKYGITRDGFAAQFQVIKNKYVHRAPEHVDYDVLALAEPLSVAMHGIRKISPRMKLVGNRAVIIGGGAIGMCIYLLLTEYFQLKEVVIFEKDKEKADYLKNTFHAEVCYDIANDDEEDYSRLYRQGGFDVAFEATGTSEGIEIALKLLKIQGELCLYGLGKTYVADMKSVVLKAIHVTGTIGGSEEFETIVQFISEKQATLRKLITKEIYYTDIEEFFRNYRSSNNLALKSQIYF